MMETDVCLGLGRAVTAGIVAWSLSKTLMLADPGLMGVTGRS